MTPKQILDSFSETLMRDERILSAQERALLASLLHHAKTTSNADPEIQAAVNKVIACAVGETVAQRAFTVLGGSIVERILAGTEASGVADVSVVSSAPQSPGPPAGKPMQPPLGPRPPTPSPAPTPQRPGRETPFAPPLPGPEPPTSARPAAVQQAFGETEMKPQQSVGVLDKPQRLLANCVVLDEFLAPQEMEELLHYTLEHETDFQISGVISPADSDVVDYNHRRSRVLMDPGKYESIIAERIKSVLPLVLPKLEMEEFAVARFESQITASNDGDFFRNHHDNCQAEVLSRQLTFVYFFHREPRQFEGGELRIHDARLEEGRYVTTGSYQSIVPEQNQIVFFPCSLLHEITPVQCPSGRFADSRFTLNGWLRR